MDDCQLVNTSAESSNSEMVYGFEEDENDALAFLSAISEHDTELIETVMCHFREKFENLPEVWI
jgi:protein EFR3